MILEYLLPYLLIVIKSNQSEQEQLYLDFELEVYLTDSHQIVYCLSYTMNCSKFLNPLFIINK